VGVLHRGRLVLQEHLDDLRRATGRVLLVTSHPDRAAERLGTRLEERDGRRLLVRADDVADLAAELVAAGVPVEELTPERRTLEQIVLEATRETGTPRVAVVR
jgi:ABC-2 type transport system ATP-binding protein